MSAMSLSAGSLIAGSLVGRLLNGVPAGTVIALAAWVLLRTFGRRNSSTRFALWFAALLAIAASPLLGSLTSSHAGMNCAPVITVPSSWAVVLLSCWGAIACLGLLRVGFGMWGLRKARTEYETLDPQSLDPSLQATLGGFRLSRKVTLAVSNRLRVPTAIGFFNPMIIFPSWALKELSPEELNSILIHELAHLKRWDDFTNLAQKIIGAVLFFNPAVWWLESRLSLEREMACDDMVLSRTENPRAYAECLVTVAEKSVVRCGIALAQAAVSRMRQTSRRVAQILDGERHGIARAWKPAMALVTVFAAGCLIIESNAPELVAFQALPEHSSPFVATSAGTPQAMLIPAHFTPNQHAPAEVGPMAARFKAKPRFTAKHAAAFATKANQPNPMLVSFRASDVITTQTVVVVMQTSENGSTAPTWTLCVWSVTFVKSGKVPVGSRISAKSI
jgi:beta-lactamase regulating signal transducer with metallopeptidase domain